MDKKNLRKFAFAFGVFVCVPGLIAWLNGKEIPAYIFFSIGGYSLFSAIVFPPLITPIHWGMVRFGQVAGRANSVVILSAIYFLVATPVNIVLSLLKRDRFNLRPAKSADTYWEEKSGPPGRESYERQF